jgi:hypothetical protein
MITNKLLTLGLALTLMSPLASYARMGAESGGGGDAVMVNGQLVMRDMINTDQTVKIKDNLAFINKAPKFREMIHKIAKVNPEFATDIVNELLTVNIYTSPTSLPVLPYSVTTLSGKGAEVQLATRVNDDVIFAPEFNTFSQKEDVLLHEALHGLLLENSGPFHHQRVRNIVKYIHQNLDNLDEDALSDILAENYWRSSSLPDRVEGWKYIWNSENDYSLRCYMNARYDAGSVVKFENLKCLGNGQIYFSSPLTMTFEREPNLEKFMTERFPKMVALRGTESYIGTGEYSSADLFKLEKDGLFTKKYETEYKKRRCQNTTSKIEEIKDYIVKYKNYVTATKMLIDVLEKENMSDLEKEIVVEAMYLPLRENEDVQSVLVKLEDLIVGKVELLKTLNTQKNSCDKQYPNL